MLKAANGFLSRVRKDEPRFFGMASARVSSGFGAGERVSKVIASSPSG
jgi:hypothetical protein